MEWVLTAIAAAILFWWFYVRQGNLPFWQLAAKHPDEAYKFFMEEDCWFIDDIPGGVNTRDLTGPFKLFVPSLSRSIKLHAITDKCEESQAKFKKRYDVN